MKLNTVSRPVRSTYREYIFPPISCHWKKVNFGSWWVNYFLNKIYNSARCLQIDLFYFTVPKSSGDRKRPDTSPVVARAATHQRQQLQKANQALQVPAVALYPSRKKVPVKDLPPFGKTSYFWYFNIIKSSNTNILMLLLYINGSHKALSYCVCTGTSSPQSLKKILSLSEEAGERHRKQTEDSVSNNSSQLSSPPTSPHSSPKKGKDTLGQTHYGIRYILKCRFSPASSLCTLDLISPLTCQWTVE